MSLCFAFLGVNLSFASFEEFNCVPVNLSCGHTIVCGDSAEEMIDATWEAEQVFCGD